MKTAASIALAGVLSLSLYGVVGGEDGPAAPKAAAQRMKLPPGFKATLFAGEPDVMQPIAFTFDDRGRLWVAECYSYPKWHKDPKEVGRDRVLIFEDTDGDGVFDKRTVFASKLTNISGIAHGFGGVWLCATPKLIFIPDRNGDDVPDGPAEVVLDGWDIEARHNVFNGLIWGPDGWLYGCNGIMSHSKVGRPGALDDQRVALDCGVWRFHPISRRFEAVAWGTTNPWGLDFDDYGQMFITNCVIHHLWHVVPGAHFQRMHGQDLNPHCYSLMQSVADHIHWGGGHWTTSRGGQGAHGDAGGGHAHSGAMIYLGDNWPKAYRNGAFMCNIHGSRVNHDLLERKGSTYVARHGQDFLFANDPWFRGLALQYGPDGGVYVLDWTDTGECHNYKAVDQTNGRIFKVSYGNPPHRPENLAELSDDDLVGRLKHANDWHVRHARRLLQERAAAKKLNAVALQTLKADMQYGTDVKHRLRALWTMHAIGKLTEETLLSTIQQPSEYERAWGVRFLVEDAPTDHALDQLGTLAENDPSPLVRLHIASAMQRLEPAQRWNIVRRLLRHQQDADDLYLPLMYWYAVEPLPPADAEKSVELLAACEVPLVREYLTRRLVTLPGSDALEKVVAYLRTLEDPARQRDVLRGMQDGLAGARNLPMPRDWTEAYLPLSESPLTEVRDRSLALAVQFGDERALTALKEITRDRHSAAPRRQAALNTLVFKKAADLPSLLHDAVSDPVLRPQAIRGLAAFDDADTPKLLLKSYAAWAPEEKADVVQTLASRPAYALALLDAVDKGAVARGDIGAFTVRQLQALKSKDVNARLEQVWGAVRPASEQKTALMAKYRAALTPAALKKADLANGRQLYAKTCAACHKLFGEGGDVGPELTGSQRGNLDYVLENVLDPSAVVARDYKVSVVQTKSGQVLTGIIKQETERAVTVQTQNDKIVLPRDEIESREPSPLSMMPENLIEPMPPQDVRDLVAYLASPIQVPLPSNIKRAEK